MRIVMIGIAATLVAACETAPEQVTRTADAQATYDKMLAGKTAGKAMSCLASRRAGDMVVIDDDTILFRDGRTVYVNKPLGSCTNLSNQSYALATANTGPQLCRGDLANVIDASAGITVGACALGDFVPYRTAQKN